MDISVVSQGGQTTLELSGSTYEVSLYRGKNQLDDKQGSKSEFKLEENDAKKVVEEINNLMKTSNTRAEYEVHERFGDIMIRIIDEDTKEIVVEYPPKKILDLVAKMCENAGLFMDKKA